MAFKCAATSVMVGSESKGGQHNGIKELDNRQLHNIYAIHFIFISFLVVGFLLCGAQRARVQGTPHNRNPH